MKVRQPSRHLNNQHEFHDDLYKLTRGNMSFGTGPANSININDQSQNIAGQWVQVTSPVAPNTEFAVIHSLAKVPTGFDVKNKNAACDVYAGPTAWTATTVYLKASAASVQLTLFLLG